MVKRIVTQHDFDKDATLAERGINVGDEHEFENETAPEAPAADAPSSENAATPEAPAPEAQPHP